MKNKNLRIKFSLLFSAVMWLAATVTTPAFADNAVKLKILVITTGEVTEDIGYAYIKPVLDEMGVPYDVLNAATQDLTAAMLASNARGASCLAAEAGCVGNYNGIILTDSDLCQPSRRPNGTCCTITRKTLVSGRRCCQDGRRHTGTRSLLSESTWIMVWSIPPAEPAMKANGACRRHSQGSF